MSTRRLADRLDHRLGRLVHRPLALLLAAAAIVCAAGAAVAWSMPGGVSRWTGGAFLAGSAAVLAALAARTRRRQRLSDLLDAQ